MPKIPDREHLLCSIAKAAIRHPDQLFSGIRTILVGFTFETPAIPVVTLEQLGYGKNKINQLDKTYWNEEEANRVRAILNKRTDHEFSSVAMSLRNQAKVDSRSMGWCMCSLVVTRVRRGPETVTMQYRSTELTKKFGGDLIYLPLIFDRLGLKPDLIRFQFANAYLSGVFFPYLCGFWPRGPAGLLSYLETNNSKLFYGSTRFFLRSACNPGKKFAYSPENQAHIFAWKNLDMKFVRDYLYKRYKAMGKSLADKYYAEKGICDD